MTREEEIIAVLWPDIPADGRTMVWRFCGCVGPLEHHHEHCPLLKRLRTVLPPEHPLDEAFVDRVAQQSYTESSNMATVFKPWNDLVEEQRELIREVVRDMLNTPAMRGLLEAAGT